MEELLEDDSIKDESDVLKEYRDYCSISIYPVNVSFEVQDSNNVKTWHIVMKSGNLIDSSTIYTKIPLKEMFDLTSAFIKYNEEPRIFSKPIFSSRSSEKNKDIVEFSGIDYATGASLTTQGLTQNQTDYIFSQLDVKQEYEAPKKF